MRTPPFVLAHAHFAEMKDAHYDVAVLPWGATEPHNLHLPYGTDNIETERVAAASAAIASRLGARIIVLPTIPIGVNTGQLDLTLTLNLNPSTQMAILTDIITALEGYNIPRLVIMNGHGGNDFRQIIREIQPRHKMILCAINWYKTVPLKEYFDAPGDHADEMETSLMMHIAPETMLPLSQAGTGTEKKARLQGFREGWAWTPRRWSRVSADTGVGNPHAATQEKGKRYFDAVTEKIGSFLAGFATTTLDNLYD